MAKSSTRFVCQACGSVSPRWMGRCTECGEWNSLVEETARAAPTSLAATLARGGGGLSGGGGAPHDPGVGGGAFSYMGAAQSAPRPITQIHAIERERATTFLPEFDRVLGGGVVPGSLVLIGGDPGIGKSTVLTQVAGNVARGHGPTLYVSGEESVEQIKMRAARLGAEHDDLLLASETDVAMIASYVDQIQPKFLIIDSIQTMQSPDVDSSPGTVSQVRASTAALAAIAKGKRIPVFLVGHVTKEGAIAGPRVLEHMVDTVLYFEGDRHLTYRILRAVKNRFGSTDELGIFEMREEGLVGVENPSEVFLAERPEKTPGSTVTATIEGTRPILVEIQALVAPSYLGSARRMTNGVNRDRVSLILAVLEKRVGLNLANQDVYVNVAGGVKIEEPAIDLAIAVAVASNFKEMPVDPKAVFLGEIGLAGEVRGCSQVEKRLKESSRLGFDIAMLPQKNIGRDSKGQGIALIGIDSLRSAVDKALLSPDGS
ncbi:MAG TPA: DNA repair protein RadA [Armatimonadaceae bacterium]|nr:DNA repair protein RadA [Armatimonadaceae bacterium]